MAKTRSPANRPEKPTRRRYVGAEAQLEGWFDKPLAEIRNELRALANDVAWLVPWDQLDASRRRLVAQQYDGQRAPAYERRARAEFAIGFNEAQWNALLLAFDARSDEESARRWIAWRRRYGERLRELVAQQKDGYAQKRRASAGDRTLRVRQGARREDERAPALTEGALRAFVDDYRSKRNGDRGVWTAAATHFDASADTIRRRRREWGID